jgi:hypothetical protein
VVEIAQVAPFGCRWTLGVGLGNVREPPTLSNGIKQFLGPMLRLSYLGRARRLWRGNQYFAKANLFWYPDPERGIGLGVVTEGYAQDKS